MDGVHEKGKTVRVSLEKDTGPQARGPSGCRERRASRSVSNGPRSIGARTIPFISTCRDTRSPLPAGRYRLSSVSVTYGVQKDNDWKATIQGPEFEVDAGKIRQVDLGGLVLSVRVMNENDRNRTHAKERSVFAQARRSTWPHRSRARPAKSTHGSSEGPAKRFRGRQCAPHDPRCGRQDRGCGRHAVYLKRQLRVLVARTRGQAGPLHGHDDARHRPAGRRDQRRARAHPRVSRPWGRLNSGTVANSSQPCSCVPRASRPCVSRASCPRFEGLGSPNAIHRVWETHPDWPPPSCRSEEWRDRSCSSGQSGDWRSRQSFSQGVCPPLGACPRGEFAGTWARRA